MHASGNLARPVLRVLLAAPLLGALAGCVEPGLAPGLSGRDQEWERLRSEDGFAIVSASHDRAVLSALGRRIAVQPLPGFCLARESIQTSERSAFLLIGDCALEGPEGSGPDGAEAELDLPPGTPAIITLAISGDPGFAGRETGADHLSEIEAFLATADGRALLGRGGDGGEVAVVSTRRADDILYVLVDDPNGGAVPVLAPRFWRAFVELNERLAVVTVSGFRDRPLPEDEMLRYLGDQVRQLQLANSGPADDSAVVLVERGEGAATADQIEGETAPVALTDLKPTAVIVSTAEEREGSSPEPLSGETVAATEGSDGDPWDALPRAQGGPDVDEVPEAEMRDAPEQSPVADGAAGALTGSLTGGAASIAKQAEERRP